MDRYTDWLLSNSSSRQHWVMCNRDHQRQDIGSSKQHFCESFKASANCFCGIAKHAPCNKYVSSSIWVDLRKILVVNITRWFIHWTCWPTTGGMCSISASHAHAETTRSSNWCPPAHFPGHSHNLSRCFSEKSRGHPLSTFSIWTNQSS
jgi:hypothetical protein